MKIPASQGILDLVTLLSPRWNKRTKYVLATNRLLRNSWKISVCNMKNTSVSRCFSFTFLYKMPLNLLKKPQPNPTTSILVIPLCDFGLLVDCSPPSLSLFFFFRGLFFVTLLPSVQCQLFSTHKSLLPQHLKLWMQKSNDAAGNSIHDFNYCI